MGFNPMNTREYIENCLFIRDKDMNIVPFRINPPQQKLYAAMKRQQDAGLPVRIIVLKARQMGFSTLTGGMMFARCATGKNRRGLITAHDTKSTGELFEMHRIFLKNLPKPMRPQVAASNGYEMVFDRPEKSRSKKPGLGSRIRVATAGGDAIGRGSTLTYAHLSEYAFWPGDPNENYISIMQALPNRPGTICVIESTANGFNDFKDKWDRAVDRQRRGDLNGFQPIFFAWHEMPEYRIPVPEGFQRTRDEEELARLYGLDDEQLAWRRWCITTNCDESVEKFHQEYPSCPEEAFIASGSCVFDQTALTRRIEEVRMVQPKVGSFDISYDGDNILRLKEWRWREDRAGPIRIYADPEPGVPYVIGADTAGSDGRGKDSDFFAAHVLDNRTGRQVAVLHGKMGERQFTEQLYALGKIYNDALIGIETNYSTYPNELIQLMGYRKLYVQQRVDDFTKKVLTKLGWDTDQVTRPLIIDGLKDVAKYHLELIGDITTLREMLVFIKNAAGRAEAEVGQHDDLVMALAIAHYIRGQQSTKVKQEKRKWTADMLADWRKASPEQRAEMERRWGPRK